MTNITNKLRLFGLLALFISGMYDQAWATGNGFTPVTQCFRNAGATGWIMQLYDNGVKNNTVPLTAASGADVAGLGWLRLTAAAGDKSGSAYYNLPINVTQLGIQAQFSYTAWGGSGADGISLYLFDGSTTPALFHQGVFGGGLGYCQQTNYGGSTLNGLSNAVVGVGIDDWGNFANDVDRCPNYGENGRKNTPYGSIAVRGPGNGQNGYNWLADNITLPTSTSTWYRTSTSTRPTASQFYRNVLVNISPATVGSTSSYNVSTSWMTSPSGTYTQLLTAPYPTGNTVPSGSTNNEKSFTLPTTTGDAWTPLPPTVKFGFGASTGGSTNYHEIQDAYFTEGLPDLAITQNIYSESGGVGTFLVTVTNLGSTTATNARITATISGLSGVLWSCIPSSGSSCPAANGSNGLTSLNFSLGTVGNVTFIFKGQAPSSTTVVSDTVSVDSTFTGSAGTNVTDADLTSNGACTSTASGTTTMAASSPLPAYTCTSATASGITTLNLAQLPQTSDSSADNTVTGGQVQSTTQVYIASYNSSNWWGGLSASNLVSATCTTAMVTAGTCNTAQATASTSVLTSLSSTANWDAGCLLTGGSCTKTGATYTATTPSSRAILTWDGGAGLSFASASSYLGTDPIIASSSYKCGTGSTACTSTDVLNYLTGDRSNEQGDTSPGPFRTRTGTLGDIISSNPTFVGVPVASYPTTTSWSDLLNTSTTMPENPIAPSTTNSYAAYQTAQATRLNVVYVASNDGMVHGFRTGSFTSGSSPTYVSTTNDGLEVLAYMPGAVLSQIAQNSIAYLPGTGNATTTPVGTTIFGTNYNFTDPSYTHHFFANASPSTNDLFYNGAWHSWLVGGLAGGGGAIYALDVTTPANFSQSNASSLVVKELNTANLVCTGTSSCANDLGYTYGTPVITRMHNGLWAVIFGNGYNSTNGHAAVFVAVITSTTGTSLPTWTVYELQTNSNLPNGIAYVTPYDLDNDNVTDYLYAGDLFGSVWRFDVTSSSPSSWGASNFSGTSTPSNSGTNASPIFTATNVNGIAQPITTAILIQNNTLNGLPQPLLMFGTGKNLEASDLLPDNTSNGVQSIYGVWDWNMVAWNASSSKKFASLAAPQTITRSVMQQQSVTGTYDGGGGAFCTSATSTGCTVASTSGYRTLSGTTVCWSGSTACSTNTKLGFYLDLPSLGEEVLYSGVMVNNLFTVNTTIPSPQTQGMTCTLAPLPGGWTMAINPINGGVLLTGTTPFNTTAAVKTATTLPVSGMFVSGVGTPSVVTYNNQTYLINKTSAGGASVNENNQNTAIASPVGKRLSWIELR